MRHYIYYITFSPISSDSTVSRLRNQLLRAQKCAQKYKEENDRYRKLFTSVQCERLAGKNVRWTDEEISQGNLLRAHGARAYDILRDLGFPFPSPSTLKKWCANVNIQPGFLCPVLKHLDEQQNTDWDRLCVVSIDEMKVKREFEYLKDWQRVILPSDYCQVVMVRGLCSKWQQVVYYNFGIKSSKELITYVLNMLETYNLIPVAVVSDMGPDNQAMWKSLGVTYENPMILSPAQRNVFVFADMPHMIKLCRNHFIDNGITINLGSEHKMVSKKPIKRLIDIKSKGLNIAHKITLQHINVERTRRMNVRLAVQLLSRSTGAALLSLRDIQVKKKIPANSNPIETEDTANFCFMMNDLFDIFNVSRPKMDSRHTRMAYGLKLSEQNELLNKTHNYILNMRTTGKKAMAPFQRGLLQDITALKMLYEYVNRTYDVQYIITERLNQDCLERMFGLLRSKGGGLNDHPTPVAMHYRLKKCILGRYNEKERLKSYCSNIQDEQEVYSWPEVIPAGELGKTIQFSLGKEFPEPEPELKKQALEYVAGYISHTKGQPQPFLSTDESKMINASYAEYANQGGLNIPSSRIVENTEKLNKIFEETDFLGPDLMNKLMTEASDISICDKKKKKFFNTCIYNKLKELNTVMKHERQVKPKLVSTDRKTMKKYKKIINYKNLLLSTFMRFVQQGVQMRSWVSI